MTVAAHGLSERAAWILLASVSGVGERTFWALVARHGGASPVLSEVAAGRRIEAGDVRLTGLAKERIRAAVDDPLAVVRRLDEMHLWTQTPLDHDFPDRLRILDPPPAVLHGWGDQKATDAPRMIAVVGTRRPTPGARVLAARVAKRLTEVGAVVVSGLAIGIDGAAHAATVAAGGRTVAVIGGGHAHPGPRAHRALVGDLLACGGAVLSEHPPDGIPTKGTFPRRNRIISALADATIVVEAPARSGALITARLALEQGRPVLAAPGRPNDPHTAGCLALLRETPARPLVGLDEMIVDLGLDSGLPTGTARTAVPLSLQGALDLLGPTERAVAARIAAGPVSPDALVAVTGLDAPIVSGALTLLLLRGWVQALGPMYLPAGPLLADPRPS